MSLFDPIQPLKLSDTFYNWWEATNDISAALNPLNIYDVSAGPGITVSRVTGGVAVLSVNVGCGLRHDANVSLTLDIQSLPEKTLPNEEDNYIIELANSTNVTPSATDCETFRRVEATNILPFTVSGDHNFIGGVSSAITFSSTNFTVESTNTHLKDNSIKLGNVSSTTRSSISSVGFFIDALDEDPTWIYRGDLLAWYTNQNIGISYDQSFVSDGPSGTANAKFNFSPRGATQTNVEINLLLGTRSSEIVTTDVDEAITIRAIDTTNAFDVSFTDTAGARVPLFYSKYDGGVVLFNIGGRIYIEDIQNSSQFLTISDYSQHKVPLTNTDGILNYRYTNRYVSSSFDGSVVVGNVVRWNGTQFVRAQANNETNSQIFGVVERLSGGKIWIALSGTFDATGLVSGSTYYLSQSSPGQLTTTKPTTGIVKPVYVAASTTSGVINSSASASSPTFANVQISGGALVDADSVGDTLTLIPGANITIEKNTNNEIEISAVSLSQADYFKTVTGNTGTYTASGEDTVAFLGGNGITTSANSVLKRVTIVGSNSYSKVQILGQDTGELDYLVEAEQAADTLYLRSGVGINITSGTNNDIVIEATGLSVPADGSITNDKLDDMVPFSIKGAQANGRPVDIFDVNDRLYIGGYNVTPGTGPLDPETYTENRAGGQVFESLSSISGETLLASAPHEEIAGYVFGRWTSESGNVSEIIPLGRTELRSILGASPTGFLEENSNLFNSWYLYESDQETEINSVIAQTKVGRLVFVEGNNISLSRVSGVGPGNDLGIRIDAANTAGGFQTITNTRTGESFNTGDVAGIIEIDDNDAIGVELNTNLGLVFFIKPESITNDMLANMPFNSVKASIHDTDNPNPIDLQIGTNEVLGRTTGVLKSLNSTELKQILGLTSSFYFKSISLQDQSGAAVSGSTVVASSGSEEFILRSGTNISISKINGQSGYQINALSGGGGGGGLTKVIISDISPIVSLDNPSTLQFGLVNLTYPTGFGATGNYTNIDYIGSVEGTTIANDIDLAPMPQWSVKVASPDTAQRNGSQQHLATNLVLGANEILCRPTGALSVLGRTIRQIAAEANGISYFRTITSGSDITISDGPNKLALVPGARISISPEYNATTATAQFTITSQTVLLSDLTPTLGANLNVSTFSLTKSGSSVLAFGASIGDTRHLTVSSGASSTGIPTITATTSESLLPHVDIGLTPLRSGSVVIGGTSPQIKTANLTPLIINGTSTSTTAKNISFDSGTTAIVTIGCTSATKHLALQVAAAGFDVRVTSPSNTNYCAFRFDGNNTGIITNNTSGNLILVSGATGSTTIPTSGSTSVQFNSDILLSAKSIKAVNNNITIDTNTNDFTGSLKLKSTIKSGFFRVKNGSVIIPAVGSITGTGGMANSGYLDIINYSTTTEKAIKYFMYIQNNAIPDDSGLVEFDVVINGNNFRSLEIVKTMLNGNLAFLSSIVGIASAIGDNAQGDSSVFSVCPNGTYDELSANLVGIVLNRCIDPGTYNITLHKMSIEA